MATNGPWFQAEEDITVSVEQVDSFWGIDADGNVN
jgi:hypothetical protein